MENDGIDILYILLFFNIINILDNYFLIANTSSELLSGNPLSIGRHLSEDIVMKHNTLFFDNAEIVCRINDVHRILICLLHHF